MNTSLPDSPESGPPDGDFDRKLRERTGCGVVVWGLVTSLFIVFVLAGVFAPDLPELPRNAAAPTVKSPDYDDLKNHAKFFVDHLLDKWAIGDSGAEDWKDGVQPQSLFAVRDYTYVADGRFGQQGQPLPNRMWVRYRIKSSTQGGLHIEKLWDIELEIVGDEWKVTALVPSQQ